MYHRSVIQKVFVETPLFLGVDQSKTTFKNGFQNEPPLQMTLFVGAALDPAAPTNQILEVARSRTASKNGRPIVKLRIKIQSFQMILDINDPN
jgi:hypothetical protein